MQRLSTNTLVKIQIIPTSSILKPTFYSLKCCGLNSLVLQIFTRLNIISTPKDNEIGRRLASGNLWGRKISIMRYLFWKF